MPKDSDSFKQEDNSNSKMIAIPPTTQVEEVLISDEEQAESEDPQPYEFRLNKKLEDLGLYEEGMTIQQKEELLSVVVASWQTAEEEKTRRQFYQDYVNASEAFCNDQMEFTFTESPDGSNNASTYNVTSQYYDIPLSQAGSSTASQSKDFETKASIPNGDINQHLGYTSDIASDSSLDNYEDTNCASSSELFISSQEKSRVQSERKGKLKRVRLKHTAMLSIVDPIQSSSANIESLRESQVIGKKPKKESNDLRTSAWAPCLSPNKDIPLSCSKRPWLAQSESPCDSGDEDCASKILNLVRDFDYARLSKMYSHSPDRTIAKPYHLNHVGNFCQKATKPDEIDTLVGVGASHNNLPTFPNFTEAFGGTSDDSLLQIQTDRNRPPNDLGAMTTRSGLKYGLYCDQDESLARDAYQMLNESEETDEAVSKWSTALEDTNLYSEVEVILDESLPKFNNLRPRLYGEGFTLIEEVLGDVNSVHKFEDVQEAKSHSGSDGLEKVNHNAHSTYVDNNSSDGSSVIDVETVVDEDIEEFVLKRKLLEEYQCTDKEPKTSQSKRLKKTS
ncbi:hypothetical protein JTE90_016383 [Oedothorax gibbosus]|uniref:Uncharacterized protein n=1 Tax=Oedothorax gibbosus TaxID=931172 RepID=A0AAV6U7P1_9ARAC|nr:hypothetical protein JTE90_016383 [Oedothorax gibbosus]